MKKIKYQIEEKIKIENYINQDKNRHSRRYGKINIFCDKNKEMNNNINKNKNTNEESSIKKRKNLIMDKLFKYNKITKENIKENTNEINIITEIKWLKFKNS